jgi:hypothetical protein
MTVNGTGMCSRDCVVEIYVDTVLTCTIILFCSIL